MSNFDNKVLSFEPYGPHKGVWIVELECGHKRKNFTHGNCKTPPKKVFYSKCCTLGKD